MYGNKRERGREFWPQAADNERQESAYSSCGVTPETAVALLARASVRPEGAGFSVEVEREYAFYLNSSDPVEGIYETTSVKGQRVLTVGGSGEFPQIFLAKGARQVDVRDYSLPACFWSELKLVASKHLDYQDFYGLFGTIDRALETRDELDQKRMQGAARTRLPAVPIFDPTLFLRIKDRLSPQAQSFFEELQGPKYVSFFNFDPQRLDDNHWWGMARFRSVAGVNGIHDSKIIEDSPVLKTPGRYEQLHQNLQTAAWSVTPGNLEELRDASAYDFVYLSNITYGGVLSVAGE